MSGLFWLAQSLKKDSNTLLVRVQFTTSVTEYNGKIIDEKFLALINPAIIKFKPEAKKSFEEAVESISGYRIW